jgi:hypothetical protein
VHGAVERRDDVRPRTHDGIDASLLERLDREAHRQQRRKAIAVEEGVRNPGLIAFGRRIDVRFERLSRAIARVPSRAEGGKERCFRFEDIGDRVERLRDG